MSERYSKFSFLKNVGSGWLALVVGGGVGFLSLAILMENLGKELYGVSALVTSFIAMFQFLSFGLPPTLLRFFSRAFVKNDVEEIRKISSTSQALLGGLGILGSLAFMACFPQFIAFYSISDELRGDVFLLFCATAFNFFETFYCIPFFAVVQAKNRYDLGNYNRCIASLLRLLVLWFGFRCFDPTLRVLAFSIFADVLYRCVSIVYLAFRLEGANLLFRRRYVSRSLLPSLFSFGVYNLINSIFFSASIQVPNLIIGKTLDKEAVAAFAPTLLLCTFFSSILASISAPLTPLASRDAIQSEGKNLGHWATILGEAVSIVGCLSIVGLAVLGDDLIVLWLGDSLKWTVPTMTVMVAGIAFAQIQAVNYNLALGASTIKPVAYSSVVMAILTATGTFVGTRYFGWSLFGVACCITGVRVLRNTFYLAFAYSRIFHYRYFVYTWRVYCRPLILATLVCALFKLAKKCLPVYEPSYVALIVGSIAVCVVYGTLTWYFLLSDEIKSRLTVLKKSPNFVQKLLNLK